MKTTVKKDELIAILRTNLEQHEKVYQEAVDGWLRSTRESLEAQLELLVAGKVDRISISTSKPENHGNDYRRAIRMLELTVDETVTLDEHESSQLIMDDWEWQQRWLNSNSRFSPSAGALSSSYYGN